MVDLLLDANSKIVSHGLTYEAVGQTWVGKNENEITLLTVDNPNMSVVSVASVPHSVRIGITRYSDGTFVGTTDRVIVEAIKQIILETPSLKEASNETILTHINEVVIGESLSLNSFFGRCVQLGAVAADFAPIWGFDGYREGVEGALLKGEIYRVADYAATIPFAVTEPTSTALSAAIAASVKSRLHLKLIEMGETPAIATLADVVLALS